MMLNIHPYMETGHKPVFPYANLKITRRRRNTF
jgi:hypothetical protein